MDNPVVRLDSLIKDYNSKIDESINYGLLKADAENTYRKALGQYLAEKVLLGNKVTVLGDMARGEPVIADLRRERDKYSVLYDATQERIFALRTEIRITETNLKLDYGRN